MSEIKNGGLDQYGAEHFEQQQFGTAGVEGVNQYVALTRKPCEIRPMLLSTNRKLHMLFLLVTNSMTLNDLERKVSFSQFFRDFVNFRSSPCQAEWRQA